MIGLRTVEASLPARVGLVLARGGAVRIRQEADRLEFDIAAADEF